MRSPNPTAHGALTVLGALCRHAAGAQPTTLNSRSNGRWCPAQKPATGAQNNLFSMFGGQTIFGRAHGAGAVSPGTKVSQ